MTDAPLMRDGPLQIGVHVSAESQTLPEQIFSELAELQPHILKINHDQERADVERLADILPGRLWILEVKTNLLGVTNSPERYVDAIAEPLYNLARLLMSREIRGLFIETQPEANRPPGGFITDSWTSGGEFGKWWLSVYYRLQEIVPEANHLFPYLLPESESMAHEPAIFLNEAREFLQRADGVAAGLNLEFVRSPESVAQITDRVLAPYVELAKPLWLSHVNVSGNQLNFGRSIQVRQLLQHLDENQPRVHGVVFYPFFSEREEDQGATWSGSPLLHQFGQILQGDFQVQREELPSVSGYVWQEAVESLEGGQLRTQTEVSVRNGPNPSSTLVGVLPAGLVIAAAGDPAGSYLPVTVDPERFLPPEQNEATMVEGWVWADALERRGDNLAVNQNVGVNVRRGPSTETAILGVLRRGAEVTVIGDLDNDFLPIQARQDDLAVQNRRLAEQSRPMPTEQQGVSEAQLSQEPLLDLGDVEPQAASKAQSSGTDAASPGVLDFRFAVPWPAEAWPGQRLETVFELENQSDEAIPVGELAVIPLARSEVDEAPQPVGPEIAIEQEIPAGKANRFSASIELARHPGKYLWRFDLNSRSLPAQPVAALEATISVIADEILLERLAEFDQMDWRQRQAMVEQAAQTIPSLTLYDPLADQLLHNIVLPGLTDEDWHVGLAALTALFSLQDENVANDESELPDLARGQIKTHPDGVTKVEQLLQRRMRNEIREWTREWLAPLQREPVSTPEPDIMQVVAEAVETTSAPASRSAAETPIADSTRAPRDESTVRPLRAIRNIQVNINQKLAASEPAGQRDRLTLIVTSQAILARLQLKGQEFSYASPFRLDRAALLKLSQEPAAYGEMLFNSIFHSEPMPGGVRLTATIEALDRLQAEGTDTVIEMVIDPAVHSSFDPADLALHSLWWEQLKQPDRAGVAKVPLATQKQTPFYRRLIGPARPPQVASPLKILVAICNPQDLGSPKYTALERLAAVDVAQEREILTDALMPLAEAGVGEFTILGGPERPASWPALRMALQEDYHILHIVAHGIFFQGYFSLVMEEKDGAAKFVSPEAFQQLVRANNRLRLVTLTSCQSAIDSSGSSLQGLGPHLVQCGIPAVIAMQSLIQVNAAQLFHQYFYNALARHGRVDQALATARHHLYHEVDEDRQWAIPVLYLGSGDGQLFTPPGDVAGKLPLLEAARAKSYQELAGAGDPSLAKATQQLRSDAQQLGLGGDLVAAMQAVIAPGMALRPAAGPDERLALPQDGGKLSSEITRPVKISAAALQAYVTATTPLILDKAIFPQLAGALSAGKHIVLTGPPGTGKTSLALTLAELARAEGMNRGATLTTATPDWTTFDTIGGYVPSRAQTLQFKPGMFLETIREGRWLIIDEMNRAEIDKAFGELFTVLSGQQVDLPYSVGENRVRILPPAGSTPGDWWPEMVRRYDYVRHPNWRIIGTMNVFDRSFLFAMSFAFMRRFAFIDVAVPEPASYGTLRRDWLARLLELAQDSPTLTGLVDQLNAIFDQSGPLMTRRALGPAIALDMIRYLAERREPWPSAVAEAMMLYVVPQLDGLDPTTIFAIYRQLQGLFGAAEQALLLPRVQELYPHIQASDWEGIENGD